MPLIPAALLAIALGVVAWFTWRDAKEYARFKALTETTDRQRFYRRWLIGAFLLFAVGSVAILAILHDLGGVIEEPTAFFALSWAFRHLLPTEALGPEFLGGIVGGAMGAMALGVALAIRRRSRRAARQPGGGEGAGAPPAAATLGDIQPLIPRNDAETWWTAALSINAGISEELFFRLTLPLLFTLVTGNAMVGFVLAGVVFGLAHIYQGWVGVAATMFLGAVFSLIYLGTGSLALPMTLHVIIDLMGLVVRPTLARRLAAR